MKYTKMLVALLATSLVLSCSKKDEKEKPQKPSEVSIIGKWKCISAKGDQPIGYDATGTPGYDFYEMGVLPDCRKNDLTIFLESKTLQLDEGETKCDPANKQTIFSGIWSVKSDTVHMEINGRSTDSRILQLDNTTLKIIYSGPYTRYYNNGTIDTVYANLNMTSTYQREK